MSTGALLQTQTDLTLAGVLPLVLSRTHKSSSRVGRWFGRTWASTLDQKIEVDSDAVRFAAADAMLLTYPVPPAAGGAVFLSEWDTQHRLLARTDPLGNIIRMAAALVGNRDEPVAAEVFRLWRIAFVPGILRPDSASPSAAKVSLRRYLHALAQATTA